MKVRDLKEFLNKFDEGLYVRVLGDDDLLFIIDELSSNIGDVQTGGEKETSINKVLVLNCKKMKKVPFL